jgi:hypothetical protein
MLKLNSSPPIRVSPQGVLQRGACGARGRVHGLRRHRRWAIRPGPCIDVECKPGAPVVADLAHEGRLHSAFCGCSWPVGRLPRPMQDGCVQAQHTRALKCRSAHANTQAHAHSHAHAHAHATTHIPSSPPAQLPLPPPPPQSAWSAPRSGTQCVMSQAARRLARRALPPATL